MRGISNFVENSQQKSQYLDQYDPVNIANFWSPEHYSVFQQSQDYNCYFYFLHRPKEKLKLGNFSSEESTLFLNNLITLYQIKQIESHEIQGNWGIFSLYMPFRNGLSCYSQYLTLKAKFFPNHSEVIASDVMRNMCSTLKNLTDLKGFCEFFMDLEPGLLQTTNQKDLLEKMNIDIKPIIKDILELRIQHSQFLEPFNRTYEICDTKSKFKEFLLKFDGESKHLEIHKPLTFEEYSKKNIRKKIKTEEKTQDFTNSALKIKQEHILKSIGINESNETVQIIRMSSSKKSSKIGKRSYKKMKENSQEQKVHFFGFNDRHFDDEGYDSEPNLEYIFEKYLDKQKRNHKKLREIQSDDELFLEIDRENNIKSLENKENLKKNEVFLRNLLMKKKEIRAPKKIRNKRLKKESKVFEYQEDRLKKKRLKLNNEFVSLKNKSNKEYYPNKIEGGGKYQKIAMNNLDIDDDLDFMLKKRVKNEENFYKNQRKNIVGEDSQMDMEENEGRFLKKIDFEEIPTFIKKKKVNIDKYRINLTNSWKFYERMRKEALEKKGNDLFFSKKYADIQLNIERARVSEEDLIEINKTLKKLKELLNSNRAGVDGVDEFHLNFLQFKTLLLGKTIDKFILLKENLIKTMIYTLKDVLYSKPLSLFMMIPQKNNYFFQVLLELWFICSKMFVDLKDSSMFNEYKLMLKQYFNLNFEAFYLKILVKNQFNEDSLQDLTDNLEVLAFLIEIIANFSEKSHLIILQEYHENFICNIKNALIKFQALFSNKLNEKQKKKLSEKIKMGFSYISMNMLQEINSENRFLEYIFWVFPYEYHEIDQFCNKIQEEVSSFGISLNHTIGFNVLLLFEFLPKENFNEFLTFFLEKAFFNENFPIKKPSTFQFLLKILEFLFRNFELETPRFLKIKEKLINIITSKDFSGETIFISRNNWYLLEKIDENLNFSDKLSWEMQISSLFSLSFSNERSKTSVSEINFLEKRVFSRVLCSLKQYDKFHGDFLKSNDFQGFSVEFFLLNSLFSLLPKDDLLLNAYKFSLKFLRNYENSHGFVKQMMFNLIRRILNFSLDNMTKNNKKQPLEILSEGFSLILKDLWVKFCGIFHDFLDIGNFLKNFSIKPQNLTENEKALLQYQQDLHENLDDNLEFFKDIIKKFPFLTQNLLENLMNSIEKTSALLSFKIETLIFPSTRMKILSLLKEIYGNIEKIVEWWENYSNKIEGEELDYEEIIKEYQRKEIYETKIRKTGIDFLENVVFLKLFETMNSILNKPLQEKIPINFQINLKVLEKSFESIGFLGRFLLKSEQEKHILMVLDKITGNFLNMNSTFFLDNSIKIVIKYDKYPYSTLQRSEKVSMIIRMLNNLLINVEKTPIFTNNIVKFKQFEDFISGILLIYGLSLFITDLETEEMKIFYINLKELYQNYRNNSSMNSKNSRDNKINLNFNELNILFQGFLVENQNLIKKPNKIINPLKIIMENFQRNLSNMKQIWRYFEEYMNFLLRNLRLEFLTTQNVTIIFKNSLNFMRYLLKFIGKNKELTSKIVKIHQDFLIFLFKRPKTSNPLEILLHIPKAFEGVSKCLIKYLFILSKTFSLENRKNEEDLISKVFGDIIEYEMKTTENQNVSFIRMFEQGLSGNSHIYIVKINLILRLFKEFFVSKRKNDYLIINPEIENHTYVFEENDDIITKTVKMEEENTIPFGEKILDFNCKTFQNDQNQDILKLNTKDNSDLIIIGPLSTEENLISRLCESFLKENGYKYQQYFLIILIFDHLKEEFQIFFRVFADIIERFIDFRFMLKLYEGLDFDSAAIRSIEIYLKVCRNFVNKILNLADNNEKINCLYELILAIQYQVQRLLIEICCFFDRNLHIKKTAFKQIPGKILPMTFLIKMDKNKLLFYCEEMLIILKLLEKFKSNEFLQEMITFLEISSSKLSISDQMFFNNLVNLIRKPLNNSNL